MLTWPSPVNSIGSWSRRTPGATSMISSDAVVCSCFVRLSPAALSLLRRGAPVPSRASLRPSSAAVTDDLAGSRSRGAGGRGAVGGRKTRRGSSAARRRSRGCRRAPGAPRPSRARRRGSSGSSACASSLIGRHVDGAVVQVLLDLGEVARRGTGGRCRSSCRTAARCAARDVLLEERQRLGAGLVQRHASTPRSRSSSPLLVCISTDDVVHLGERVVGLVDHEVGALGDDRSRSSSVTSVAISTITWRSGSSPVISRSIQASTADDDAT